MKSRTLDRTRSRPPAQAKTDSQDRAQGLVLLHYPFCHFKTWRHKFNVLDATQRSDWGHYRDARLAIVAAGAFSTFLRQSEGSPLEKAPSDDRSSTHRGDNNPTV